MCQFIMQDSIATGELSSARAINVLKYFVNAKVDPEWGFCPWLWKYKPVMPNDTAQNRAANRRVNILIVTTEQKE